MIKQYLSIKEEYPDAILFYRMGDFYEMFFEDAEIASRALDITLTSRNKNDAAPVPMCGVPHRAAQGYIARLIDQGYKVAVCDQVEDPATAKGLVKREVVRVITPGMIVDQELLDATSHNFVLALCIRSERSGLAYLDLSTGTFRLTESDAAESIIEEALRVSPQEVLLPESAKTSSDYLPVRQAFGHVACGYLADREFDRRTCYERLTGQFQTLSLEGFGCENLPAAVSAAGAIMKYVGETQKQPVGHINRMKTYRLDRYLLIDERSRQNLELSRNLQNGGRQGTLLAVMDRTVTALGARRLKTWLRAPLLDLERIRRRQDAVAETLRKSAERRRLRTRLKDVHDLERLRSKIVMGRANARDLVSLKQTLQALPEIWEVLAGFDAGILNPAMDPAGLLELAQLIEASIREDAPPVVSEGGMIKAGYHAELDELVAISRDAKTWLAELEAREREQTGINSLKVSYNRVFGYYLEVPKSRSDVVPSHYVRKQTLVNAERYITDELKQFETRVLGAEDQRNTLERALFNGICERVVRQQAELGEAARFIGRLDCLATLAEIAQDNDYHRPQWNNEGRMFIADGRHPVVEKMIRAERFVPNTIRLDNEKEQILIITGPNMAGKSTVLRQAALLVIMAQMGSFIPAREASLSITDRIFTRVGALDNLSQGQSTFLVEMQETANILNHATADSLVILDEIGRGTSTYDGLSIAWAVAEYLHDLRGCGVKTLFATHYHELTELAAEKPRVRNLNIAVKEWNDQIIFLRKLVSGGTNRSYGIQVARLAGIPLSVIDRAKKILYRIESGEHPSDHQVQQEQDRAQVNRGAKQMALFHRPDHRVLKALQALDISVMTPLDAINSLNELQRMLEPDHRDKS
jgi:DNA mismatch repair protein MutS